MGNNLFSVERCFISKLLETKDMLTVKDKQIKPLYFSGDNRNAFQFIFDTVISSGEVPSIRVFQRQFPNYELEMYHDSNGKSVVGTEENLTYWCDEVRRKVKHNKIADLVEQVSKDLVDFDTDDAYLEIKKAISYIESEVVETRDIDITKNVEDRKNAYLKKKVNHGMSGIPTGFKLLDYILGGLENKTLTTLIANTGVGKSWFTIIVAAHCILLGYKVLFFTTEMSEELIQGRLEAVLYSKCYGEIDYEKFRRGALDVKTERKFFQFLSEDLPEFQPLIISLGTSPMSVAATIDKYKPDIVFIDSVYLMDDDQGAKDDWLRITHITRDLKKLCNRTEIPIFINSQADKNTSKKTGPELGSISYAQSLGQDSDNILALYRDETMINDREMAIKVLKQREGNLGKVVMNWDFNVMNFSEIYNEVEEDEPDEDLHTLGDDVLGDDEDE